MALAAQGSACAPTRKAPDPAATESHPTEPDVARPPASAPTAATKSAAPELTPPGGTYAYGTSISLRTAEPDAALFYTLDGSEPGLGSTRYEGPIGLVRNAGGPFTVRAVAIATGKAPSDVVTGRYTTEPGTILHFKKPETWKSAYAYYWNTVPGNLTSPWPGIAMTAEGGGWYFVTLKGQTEVNVLFDGGDSPQTADIHWTKAEGWFDDWDRWDVAPERYSTCCAFPGGRYKAVVMSFDDGGFQDKRLVEIFNRHGIKGTFHLNSGLLGRSDKVAPAEVKTVYAGHEVSVHSVTHPHLEAMDQSQLSREVLQDRLALEGLLGASVRGMAYPFGSYNARLLDAMPGWGLTYGRVVPTTGDLRIASDLLRWRASCHHTGAAAVADQLLAHAKQEMALLQVWGHSWELDGGNPNSTWEYIEDVCRRLGGHEDTWYASLIEVADYLTAIRRLQFSDAHTSVQNPSSLSVWIKDRTGRPMEVKPGSSADL